jgi:hypothetical protein
MAGNYLPIIVAAAVLIAIVPDGALVPGATKALEAGENSS